MAYGVIRSDNVKATKDGNIRSAKFYDASDGQAAIENGMLVEVSNLLDASANREIFKATVPSSTTAKNIGVVATPEIIYDEQLKSAGALENFINAAGQPITVLMLAPQDILSVSDECIDGTPEVGKYVLLQEGNKWNIADTPTLATPESVQGIIVAREMYRANKYLNVIQIVVAN